MSVRLKVLSAYLFAGNLAVVAQQTACPDPNGRPMQVIGNAPIVTLQLKRSDATERAASFAFDSGGGAIILDESLARDFGLKLTGDATEEGGARFAPASLSVVQYGSMLVMLGSSKAFVHLGKNSFDTRERIGNLCTG